MGRIPVAFKHPYNHARNGCILQNPGHLQQYKNYTPYNQQHSQGEETAIATACHRQPRGIATGAVGLKTGRPCRLSPPNGPRHSLCLLILCIQVTTQLSPDKIPGCTQSFIDLIASFIGKIIDPGQFHHDLFITSSTAQRRILLVFRNNLGAKNKEQSKRTSLPEASVCQSYKNFNYITLPLLCSNVEIRLFASSAAVLYPGGCSEASS